VSPSPDDVAIVALAALGLLTIIAIVASAKDPYGDVAEALEPTEDAPPSG
jgi:hypothetical protein